MVPLHFFQTKIIPKIIQLQASFYFSIPILIGIFLRLNGISKNSIWYDESLTIFLTREPLIKMVSLLTNELNPPLWEILEWFVVRILPASETTYRLISFLCSFGTLIVSHKILKELQVDRTRQFFALMILAISPYQIWMSQDARVYALMSFLYLLGFWFIIKKNWLGLFACCGLLIYSNSAAIFYFATLLIVGLILNPQNWITLFRIGFGAMLLFSPWLAGSFLGHLSGSYFSGYNIPPVNSQRLIEQINYIFMIGLTSNPLIREILRLLNFLVILILLSSSVLYQILVKQSKQTQPVNRSLLFLATLPLILITLTAWVYQNGHLILYRSFSPIAAPIILLLTVYTRTQLKLSTVLLFVLIVLNLSYHFIWSPQEKGGHLKEVIQESSIHDEENTVIFHATATSLLPFQYYLKDASHYLLEADLPKWFLVEPLQQAFGLQKIKPEQIPSGNYWIVWAKDDHLPPFVDQIMGKMVDKSPLVGKIEYSQMATIFIFYVSQKSSFIDNP
ncbi:MAG: hypothetical protein KatS3mg046_014 [Bellilinea sp.]|nr:MAG: hypothetical protein KatS3mg046_014 [Bellilinea sp.]